MWVLKEEENSLTLPASPPVPTSLTPSPSPRGEGSDMPCALSACYWLTYYLLASLTPYWPDQPPSGLTSTPTGLTPSPSPRGEGSDMPCASTTCYWLTCQLVNWLTRQLPNHSSTSQTLVNGLTS